MLNTVLKITTTVFIALTVFVWSAFLLQYFLAHKNPVFSPSYPMEDILPLLSRELAEEDYQLLLYQTGLGEPAINALYSQPEKILKYQRAFFQQSDINCISLVGWVTREDKTDNAPDILPLEPGDILFTQSAHTMGWRHGHIGIALDQNTFLESTSLGENSIISDKEKFSQYSGYAILRKKNITPDEQQLVAEYASQNLLDVPYSILCGILTKEKAPVIDTVDFDGHCSYIVWYAYNYIGVDVDSDGGRIVTPTDIAKSQQLEIVQIYKINPQLFYSGQKN